jgi:hypothetical protein
VIDSSHIGGSADPSPVTGKSWPSAHESTGTSDEPSSVLVAIVVSWYRVQNVGDTTSHAAPDEQARSPVLPLVGTSVLDVDVVNVTSAAGVTPYTAPARSPYSIEDKAPP